MVDVFSLAVGYFLLGFIVGALYGIVNAWNRRVGFLVWIVLLVLALGSFLVGGVGGAASLGGNGDWQNAGLILALVAGMLVGVATGERAYKEVAKMPRTVNVSPEAAEKIRRILVEDARGVPDSKSAVFGSTVPADTERGRQGYG